MVILLINTFLSYAICVIMCHTCGSVYLMTAGLLRLLKLILFFIYLMACSLKNFLYMVNPLLLYSCMYLFTLVSFIVTLHLFLSVRWVSISRWGCREGGMMRGMCEQGVCVRLCIFVYFLLLMCTEISYIFIV